MKEEIRTSISTLQGKSLNIIKYLQTDKDFVHNTKGTNGKEDNPLKKLAGQKFPTLYETRKFLTVLKEPTTGHYSEPHGSSPQNLL
jgi:hypothetical protein